MQDTLIRTRDDKAEFTSENSMPRLVDDVFTDVASVHEKKPTIFTRSKGAQSEDDLMSPSQNSEVNGLGQPRSDLRLSKDKLKYFQR